MEPLYRRDLAYIHGTAFGGLAQGAAPEIIRVLNSAPVQIKRVVDIGCGAGPLSAALAETGFEVTGIDPSAELLSIAREASSMASFIHGSVYDVELPDCEAILAVGEPLTYHSEPAIADSLVESLFRRASEILPEGGMLIFDVIELGGPSLNHRYWSSGDDWAVLAKTEEDQSSRTLVRHIETFRQIGEFYRRECETHRVRLFETSTLLSQLAECGFSTATAQAYGTQPLSPRRRAFFSTRSNRGRIQCRGL
ncbi:MAG TPA: class I SAM-dependent methyltransferase [Bryobacteraceae bacterium]|jgi:SAM-dependent methyltransferase|nr:class I SAM-dependent methyltransferase [Bryobacteraceae bacterium]